MSDVAAPLTASDQRTMVVVWVGLAALMRGISEIIFAFTLKHMRGAV